MKYKAKKWGFIISVADWSPVVELRRADGTLVKAEKFSDHVAAVMAARALVAGK